MRQLRILDEFAEGSFRDRPDEIDDYRTEIFQDFAEDNDTGALLAVLRVLARVRGVSDMVDRARNAIAIYKIRSSNAPATLKLSCVGRSPFRRLRA